METTDKKNINYYFGYFLKYFKVAEFLQVTFVVVAECGSVLIFTLKYFIWRSKVGSKKIRFPDNFQWNDFQTITVNVH